LEAGVVLRWLRIGTEQPALGIGRSRSAAPVGGRLGRFGSGFLRRFFPSGLLGRLLGRVVDESALGVVVGSRWSSVVIEESVIGGLCGRFLGRFLSRGFRRGFGCVVVAP